MAVWGIYNREGRSGLTNNALVNDDVEIFAIKNAQSGDEEAWRSLFEWHFDVIYRYCLNLASGRQTIAEEITQQVFIIAAQRISKFRVTQGTLRAWLLGIAKNRFIKYVSKESRRKAHETKFSTRDPKRENEHLAQHLVYEALARLPLRYRLVLEAKYLQGLTVNQIAETQGYTIKATESLLVRAREKFAKVYTQICK